MCGRSSANSAQSKQSEEDRNTDQSIRAIEISDTDFPDLISESNKPVLVYFWAPWCVPCRQLTPTIDDIARQYSDRAVVAKLNTQMFQQTPAQLGVRGIPTIIITQNGKEVERFVGLQSAATYREALDKHI